MSATRNTKRGLRTRAFMLLAGLGVVGAGLLAVGPDHSSRPVSSRPVMNAPAMPAADAERALPKAEGRQQKLAMVPVEMFADRDDTPIDLWDAFTQSYIEGSRQAAEMYDWQAILSGDPHLGDLRQRLVALSLKVETDQIRPTTTALLDFRVHDIGVKRGDVPEMDPDAGAYWQLYRLITERRNETADAFQLLKNEALRARGQHVTREKSYEIPEMFRERPG